MVMNPSRRGLGTGNESEGPPTDSSAATIAGGKRSGISAPRTAEALVGMTLRGTYRIDNMLDEGGMGTVYAAEHVRLHRRVAVKVLARHLSQDVNALARFQREAEIVSQLHHPHIVHILDFDTTDAGEPYIVMEFLRGEPLTSRLDRIGALPLVDVLTIVCQVASGLQVAHHAGIVHRDLKPDNIYLLDMEDDTVFVKLLDFGISKSVGARGTNVTQEFDVLGTPEYMAPEQALGKAATVTHHADQFSLAAITYEALCGVIPFSASTVMLILQKVIGHQPPQVHTLLDSIPLAVSSVLQRGLAKSSVDRYDSVSDFANALVAAVGAPPSPAPFSLRIPSHSVPVRIPPHEEHTRSAPPRPQSRPANSRPRAPDAIANATVPPPPVDPVEALTEELAQARQALAFGEDSNAYRHAQRGLELASTTNEEGARRAISASAALLETILVNQIGGTSKRLKMVNAPESSDASVTPQQAYLLSRLDGGSSVEEVLDLSPLSRVETLRVLLEFRDRGVVELW